MPKWIIFSIMQIFMDIIQKEWVLGLFLWDVYMDYLPHKRVLNSCELGRRERVQNVKRFKGREKNRRLKKASQLMKAKQRVFWGSQVLQVKAVPCSQHMQLIIQLDTDLGSMVRSNLFMGINCSSEYSSLPLASACLPSVSIQGFLVHLFLSFFFFLSAQASLSLFRSLGDSLCQMGQQDDALCSGTLLCSGYQCWMHWQDFFVLAGHIRLPFHSYIHWVSMNIKK